MTQWSNPIGLAAQERAVNMSMHRHGDKIWDCICAIGANRKVWRTKQVLESLQVEYPNFHPTTIHNMFTGFRAYALASPDDFSGPASKLVVVARGRYRLDDNIER